MKRSMLAALAAVAALWSIANAQEEKGAVPGSSAPASAEAGAAANAGEASASGAPEAGAGGMPDAGAGNVSGAHIPAAQDVAYPGNLTLEVNLTDLDRRVLGVH